MPLPLPRARPHTRATAVALAALLFGIYMLTTGGHFYAIDEEMMFSVTEKLARYGSFALNAGVAGELPRYSQYGPAQSVAALPLYWLACAIGAFFPADSWVWLSRAVVSWFNPLVTAGVAALVYVAADLLGVRRGAAIGAALIYGLGTMAWPHSKTFFAEPLSALVLFGGCVLVLAWRERGVGAARPGGLFFCAGLLAGVAPAIKVQSVIALPFLAGYVAACVLGQLPGQRRAALMASVAWMAGVALPLALLGFYQYWLFGSPLRTGYGASVLEGFVTPFWVGFNGQLWSSGRGILWYAPPLLLFPLGLWRLWRRDRRLALLCLLLPLAHVLFYAKWVAWDGAGAWGPRFLNAPLPFLVLPLALWLDTLRGRTTPARVAALVLVLLLAVPVQLGGLAINLNTFLSATRGTALSNYRPADSAIAGHLLLARDRLSAWYAMHFTPASVVLADGFSNSEQGDAHLPRWSRPRAMLALHPPPGHTMVLTLQLMSCWARPTPGHVTIRVGGLVLVNDDTPCPQREYRLLLPARPTTVELSATPWRPADYGDDRDELLGVYVQGVAAVVDGRPLALVSESLPIPPMPLGAFSMRKWMGDHRMNQWDFWWWYLRYDGAPPAAHWALAAGWLALAGGSLLMGARGLRRR